MRILTRVILPFTVFSLIALSPAQQPSTAVVPNLINYSGTLVLSSGAVVPAKMIGVTFAIYRQQDGGAPLWLETQNVTPDSTGHYSVLLGSSRVEGIPADLFSTQEQRWLGVQVQGQAEQARVLLVSVPYALKALDAETLGGKPATAFAMVNQGSAETMPSLAPSSGISAGATSASSAPATGTGTVNFIPKWTSASGLGNSILYQSSSSQIGLGTTAPGAKLDVVLNTKNTAAVRGTSNATSGGVGVEGVTGTSTADPGLVGVMGLNKSQYGVAGLFNTTSPNSWILEGQYNGHEIFYIDPSGRVSATQGLFISTSEQPVIAIANLNNCINTNTCNEGQLGADSGVEGIGGPGSPAGLFVSQSGGLILQGQNRVGTNMFTLDANGNVHTGSLVVDGINNTDVNGVKAFAFGTEATGVYGEADGGNNVGVEGYSEGGRAVAGYTFNGLSGVFSGTGTGVCYFDGYGDLYCTGSKSAVVPVADGRKVALYAVEAPENWFEDFGSGQLVDGVATILLDPIFGQTVNTQTKYHVYLTPNGDCRGLYVTRKTSMSFEVHELGGGISNVSFDYRIVARRKGYEHKRLPEITDTSTQRLTPQGK